MIEICLVDIQVHHAGIGASNLRKVRIAEAAADLRRFAPVGDFRVNLRVSALDNPGNDGVTLSGPLQIGYHFTHRAAGIQFAQPCRGICVRVIRGLLLLQIDQNDRHVQIPDGGKHIVGCGVSQKLQNHEVHVSGPELIPRRHCHFFCSDNAAVNQLHAVRNHALEVRILALKLRDQRRELRQIRPQRNGEHAHTRFCLHQYRLTVPLAHFPATSLISKLFLTLSRACWSDSNSPPAIICTIRFPMAVPSTGPA